MEAMQAKTEIIKLDIGTGKMLVALCLYFVSANLVYTSPNKNKKSKIIAWAFSIVVHSGLILAVALTMNIGVSVLALMIAEGCIETVSIVGLLYVALNNQLYIEACHMLLPTRLRRAGEHNVIWTSFE